MQATSICSDGSNACGNPAITPSTGDEYMEEPKIEPVLYWKDLKMMLSKKLRPVDFNIVRKLSSYEAGSETDESLANNIHGQLTDFKLDKVWNDEHYITLQVQGRYVNMPKTVSYFFILLGMDLTSATVKFCS
ncbi:transferrin receptor [Chelydra serpentina]|uniref:Transferrin receptor n=1 Tax=Chelydra serpentina TaxID=8475 RepID=A0A8T1RVD8_CHESE|nr:transferrin receptor [Chelydra serpentina]